MAVYRQIQTSFWQDDFVLQLTPEEKYFYLYLLTNSKTRQSGIYQLPMQVLIMETGYNQETVDKLLNRFITYGKIICNPVTKEIGIKNWPKYNPMESPKIKACVEKELKEIKDKSIISLIYPGRYPLQGVSQEEKEEEKEKAAAEAEEKEEPAPAHILPSASAGNIIPENNTASDPGIIPEDNSSRSPASPSENKFTPAVSEQDNCGDYNCEGIQSQAEMLLCRIWNRPKPGLEEIRITANFIMRFSFNEVEIAFKEGIKYDKKRLAYVETICAKRKERADLARKTELEKQKRLEQQRILEEQKKSGVSLGLIKAVYGP